MPEWAVAGGLPRIYHEPIEFRESTTVRGAVKTRSHQWLTRSRNPRIWIWKAGKQETWTSFMIGSAVVGGGRRWFASGSWFSLPC